MFGMAITAPAETLLVHGAGSLKGGDRLFMADGAGTGGDIGTDRRRLRRMGGMTTDALLVAHGRLMRFVTIKAGHRLAVAGMTSDAFHQGVSAGGLLHLLTRTGMTADAGFAGILHLGQGLGQRHMGIVAASAILDCEMFILLGPMTIGASRRLARFGGMIFVTFGTVAHVAMGAAVFLHGTDDGAVAAGAGFRRLGQIHLDRLGVVGRMATEAVLLAHLLTVRLMTPEALGHLGMDDMALVTVHFGMGIGAGLRRNRIGVAAGADFPGRLQVGEIDIQRLVRVMAGSTVGQGVVLRGRGIVTLGTIAIGFAPLQGMADMAAATADLLVRTPPRGQILAFVIMAIDAVPGDFSRVRGLRPDSRAGQQQTGKEAG